MSMATNRKGGEAVIAPRGGREGAFTPCHFEPGRWVFRRLQQFARLDRFPLEI